MFHNLSSHPYKPNTRYNSAICWSCGVLLEWRLNIIVEHLNSKCSTGWSYRLTGHVTHSLLLTEQRVCKQNVTLCFRPSKALTTNLARKTSQCHKRHLNKANGGSYTDISNSTVYCQRFNDQTIFTYGFFLTSAHTQSGAGQLSKSTGL